jgi:3-oxoacyl-[acyl-carrier-protein] synthase II
MSAFVQGFGAITPLGDSIASTWTALREGARAHLEGIPNALRDRKFWYAPVPGKFVRDVGREPRLRRSGHLSLMAVQAAREALHRAGDAAVEPSLVACVFAVSSGGVNHTRRFYQDIVDTGPQIASPALFPETVFNAPGSHLAALLGSNGPSYTLVGDSSVGLTATHFGARLLECGADIDRVVVVGTEEVDWILADAFHSWRMLSSSDEISVFGPKRGTILGEGAAALVLGRSGSIRIDASHSGIPFFSQADARIAARKVLAQVLDGQQVDAVLSGANGTFADAIESECFDRSLPGVPVYAHKPALGEALGASGVMQVVLACRVLTSQVLPATLSAGDSCRSVNRATRELTAVRVLAFATGFNHQANALVTSLAS